MISPATASTADSIRCTMFSSSSAGRHRRLKRIVALLFSVPPRLLSRSFTSSAAPQRTMAVRISLSMRACMTRVQCSNSRSSMPGSRLKGPFPIMSCRRASEPYAVMAFAATVEHSGSDATRASSALRKDALSVAPSLIPTRAVTMTSTGAVALSRFITTSVSALTVISTSPRSSQMTWRRASSSASAFSLASRSFSRSARSAASCAAFASASAFNLASNRSFSSAFRRRNSARISSRRFSSSSAALASASARKRILSSSRAFSAASSSSLARRRSFSASASLARRSARSSASRARSSSDISFPTTAPPPARPRFSSSILIARALHSAPSATAVPTAECASNRSLAAAPLLAAALAYPITPPSARALARASHAPHVKSGLNRSRLARASST
ncbi:predicted protein [Ostreococcus lucimarinus CCE9901]|uniref:Uncharacterized protein n=1 Tax=Ostreococcus lucimarinus (strain CCE9901) TaxID=436017 RepID=A4RYF9_OSTLU|nr:predicted protein [Ostreococcus lucimarinus CCE9901]ABO96674.1 predicted protein [Ostreococcus lucimarinus CCE9901]|eukprot:XP_001418381.1 predicted protein [Ostreococcus lucimarinus CCE9901]